MDPTALKTQTPPQGHTPTLIACFATSKMKPLHAVALAAGVTVFSTLVFVQGLGLPFRLLGTWFDPAVPGVGG